MTENLEWLVLEAFAPVFENHVYDFESGYLDLWLGLIYTAKFLDSLGYKISEIEVTGNE